MVRKDNELGTTVTQSGLEADAAKLERLRQMFVNDPAELFFAKRVLIVEGDTEALVIPVFAERNRIDLDSAGATVIGVGGKRALLDYAELAMSFGIPTAIVYDRDKANDEFNENLDKLAKAGAKVWFHDPDYEGAAKATVGEEKYREIMDRYPPAIYGVGKPRRSRMAATDPEMTPPPELMEAIQWLAAVKSKGPTEPRARTLADIEWEAAAPRAAAEPKAAPPGVNPWDG